MVGGTKKASLQQQQQKRSRCLNEFVRESSEHSNGQTPERGVESYLLLGFGRFRRERYEAFGPKVLRGMTLADSRRGSAGGGEGGRLAVVRA